MTPHGILAAIGVYVALRLSFRYRRQRVKAEPQAPTSSAMSTKPPRRSVLVSLFGDAGLVAQREIRERIRGRVFQVGTAIILLVVVAAIVIPVLTKSKSQPEQVGVVGTLSSPLRAAVMTRADALGTPMTFVSEVDESAAEADVRSGKIDLAIVDATHIVVATALSADDTSTTAQLAGAAAQILGTAAAFQAAGLTVTQADALATRSRRRFSA